MPIDFEDSLFRQLFRQLSDNLFEGVYFVDRQRRITFWNDAAIRITGYSRDEVLGSFCKDNILVHVDEEGRSLCTTARCPANHAMVKNSIVQDTVYLRHKDGQRIPVQTRIIPITDPQGKVFGAIELFQEARQEATQEERAEIERLSLADPLTGMSSRRYIERLLAAQIEEFKRIGTSCGLIFCDIDNLEHFNVVHGRQAGDKMLTVVAKTIASCLRPFDHLGRWEDDSFLAVVSKVQGWQMHAIAERIRAQVAQSFLLDPQDNPISVTVCIGATLARPSDDCDSIFARVELLLSRAKAESVNKLSMDD